MKLILTRFQNIAHVCDQMIMAYTFEDGKVVLEVFPDGRPKSPEHRAKFELAKVEELAFWEKTDVGALIANHDVKKSNIEELIQSLSCMA